MPNNLRFRLQLVDNGSTLTNRATGNTEMQPNNSKVLEYAKNFIQDNIADGEPGNYYDIDISITKQKLKKPTA